MKIVVVVLFLLGLATIGYSQENTSREYVKNASGTEELSEVVIKRAGNDFSLYLRDKNPDRNIRNLQEKFIAYDIGKDYEGYDDYFVTMETKNGVIAATYNSNGKLTRVVEKYKNVILPRTVIESVYMVYPEWRIIDDKYRYAQEEGLVTKKQYDIKIQKGNKVKTVVIHPNGEIIAGL